MRVLRVLTAWVFVRLNHDSFLVSLRALRMRLDPLVSDMCARVSRCHRCVLVEATPPGSYRVARGIVTSVNTDGTMGVEFTNGMKARSGVLLAMGAGAHHAAM